MFGLGFTEILVILIVALVFIGPKKLPDVARSIGKGYRELQNALSGIREEVNNIDTSVKEELFRDKEEKPDQKSASEYDGKKKTS